MPEKKPEEVVEKKIVEVSKVVDSTGKELEMAPERVSKLAGEALEIERRSKDLERREAALKGDAEGYAGYEKLQELVNTNPTYRKAMAAAFDDPDGVIRALNGQGAPQSDGQAGSVFESDDDSEVDRASVALRQEIESLKSQLGSIQKTQAQNVAERAAQEQSSLIDGELTSGQPWMSDEVKALAKTQVVTQMSADPNQPLSHVVAVIANQFKSALQSEKQRALELSGRNKSLLTQRPQGGTPVISTDEKLSKKDWKSGKLREKVFEAARHFGVMENQ